MWRFSFVKGGSCIGNGGGGGTDDGGVGEEGWSAGMGLRVLTAEDMRRALEQGLGITATALN